LTFRGKRGGMFYCFDKTIGKRTSLQTTHRAWPYARGIPYYFESCVLL
jgi:hypothetical protein